MRSLRGRLIVGAVLWTVGLTAVSIVVFGVSQSAREAIRGVHEHNPVVGVIAIVCMVAGVVIVRSALVPFDEMRRRLSSVRRGEQRQLEGVYPTEVQPLVDDLNALLSHSDKLVRRAIGKAGDLAHGLKTPLAILSNEAECLASRGDNELASTMAHQVAMMQRHVDYHLAQARAAGSGAAPGARSSVLTSAEGLSRALQRLHADGAVTIHVEIPEDHAFRGQREDLDEMLGNLLDNACKWAKARVMITSSHADGRLLVIVDDDGPGIDPSMREVVLQRGVRADEAAPGSGLGLAIVRDLAELYGGSIALEGAPLGGLRARLILPAC
jgi:signal transduction histidine kinase